jgi:hypothetical protein
MSSTRKTDLNSTKTSSLQRVAAAAASAEEAEAAASVEEAEAAASVEAPESAASAEGAAAVAAEGVVAGEAYG